MEEGNKGMLLLIETEKEREKRVRSKTKKKMKKKMDARDERNVKKRRKT